MFTPVETTIGALLLHQATSNLLFQNGNILGASGLLRRVFSDPSKEVVVFFVGMAASYVPMKALVPNLVTSYPSVPMTLSTSLFTLGTAATIGWGTKVNHIVGPSKGSVKLTTSRCQMVAHPDTCFAVSLD